MEKNVNLIELENRLFELMLGNETDEELINNLEKIAQKQGIETEFLKAKLLFRTAKLYSTYIKNDTNNNLSLEEIELNNQIYNYYERILTQTIILAKELGLKSSLEFSNLFSCLLWKGYFSLNHIHTYSTNNRNLSFNNNGMEVLKGTGVCLNYSQMLKDFLQLAKFPSSNVFCTVRENLNFDYSPRLKRNIDHDLKDINKKNKIKEKFEKLIMSKSRMHLVNLNITETGNLYLYDPTNIGILKLVNSKKAKVINGNGIFYLNPLTSSIFLNENVNLETLQYLFILKSFENELTKEDFCNDFTKCNELFIKYKNLFKEYRNDIENDIKNANNLFQKQKIKNWNY